MWQTCNNDNPCNVLATQCDIRCYNAIRCDKLAIRCKDLTIGCHKLQFVTNNLQSAATKWALRHPLPQIAIRCNKFAIRCKNLQSAVTNYNLLWQSCNSLQRNDIPAMYLQSIASNWQSVATNLQSAPTNCCPLRQIGNPLRRSSNPLLQIPICCDEETVLAIY